MYIFCIIFANDFWSDRTILMSVMLCVWVTYGIDDCVTALNQHWFKKWIGADLAPSHFFEQLWRRPSTPAGVSIVRESAIFRTSPLYRCVVWYHTTYISFTGAHVIQRITVINSNDYGHQIQRLWSSIPTITVINSKEYGHQSQRLRSSIPIRHPTCFHALWVTLIETNPMSPPSSTMNK